MLGSNVVQMDMLMGIFRNANADMLLCFAKNIGIGNAFQAELIGAMRAIEIAHQKCWNYLWLEQDLSMVVYALQAKIQVPCDLRNWWNNCAQMIKSMKFFVTHVYREGNQCADGLANLGLSLEQFTDMHSIPSSIQSAYVVIAPNCSTFVLKKKT
jgi:hypothetical protein